MEILQYDSVTLQDYLKIDEGIAVYESPADYDIVEDIKKVNSGEVENEDEHAEEPLELTEILNAFL